MPITLDAASSASGSTGVSTMSWNHTVGAGTDRMLVTAALFRSTKSSVVVVSQVTYAGTTMTKTIGSTNQVGVTQLITAELWTMLNPPVGTTLVEITWSQSSISHPPSGHSVSYLGTTGTGNTAGSTGNSSARSVSVTLQDAGSWLVAGHVWVGTVPGTTVSGETIRAMSTGPLRLLGDAAPGTSGANTFNITGGAAQAWAMAGLELRPSAVVGSTVVPRMTLVGVGP